VRAELEGAGKVAQFTDINPPLAAFDLGKPGLSAAKFCRHIALAHARRSAFLNQQSN